ncbi:MAG: hypothetical protein IJ666_00655 [Ruminococcus sp.]|nr:hypothetical protein [Ruminococcus sp.]
MIKELISPAVCAQCRMCCVFDIYDIWETPVFSRKMKEYIVSRKPDAEFIPKDGGYIFKAADFSPDGTFKCPALTENGCMLGDDKPFICRIFPYMVMEINGARAITAAVVCSEFYNRPLSELVGFLKNGLADRIFSYADIHPEEVRPYNENYPILLIHNS